MSLFKPKEVEEHRTTKIKLSQAEIDYRPSPKILKPPSDLLRYVCANYRDVVNIDFGPDGTQRFCLNTPINIIGAFILAELRNQFRQKYSIDKQPLPIAFEYPIIYIQNVALGVFQKDKKCIIPVLDRTGQQIFVENAIIKQGCGKTVALITTGDLAGVIAGTENENPSKSVLPGETKILTLSRFYNQMPLTEKMLPYSPQSDFQAGFESTELNIAFAQIVPNTKTSIAEDYLRARYLELIPNFPSSVEALAFFCRDQGIPFDGDKFNYITTSSINKTP